MCKSRWFDHRLSTGELRQFVNEALEGKVNKKAFIGIVTPGAANRIESLCGKKVTAIMLESEAVRYSYGKSYHLLEKDDILHYAGVINTATDIQISGKRHQNNEVLTFTKDIDGTILFAVEVRVNHGGWLSLITCYRLHKKNRGGETPHAAPKRPRG